MLENLKEKDDVANENGKANERLLTNGNRDTALELEDGVRGASGSGEGSG